MCAISTVLHCTALHCAVLCCAVLCCAVLYCIILHSTLYISREFSYAILYCITPFYTMTNYDIAIAILLPMFSLR